MEEDISKDVPLSVGLLDTHHRVGAAESDLDDGFQWTLGAPSESTANTHAPNSGLQFTLLDIWSVHGDPFDQDSAIPAPITQLN